MPPRPSRDPAPRSVEVPRALLWGLVALALAGALSAAYLLGRLSGGPRPPTAAEAPAAAVPAPPVSDSTSPGSTSPSPAVPVETAEGTAPSPPPESLAPGTAPGGSAETSSVASAAQAPASAPPASAEERREVQSYFAEVDRLLQGHSFSGDPQALAQRLLQQATSGDRSGLDALFAAQEAAARGLRGLEAPPACQEHQRRTLALAEKTLGLGRKILAGLSGGDAGQLMLLASLGREAEQEAREVLDLDRRLREAYGVPTPP